MKSLFKINIAVSTIFLMSCSVVTVREDGAEENSVQSQSIKLPPANQVSDASCATLLNSLPGDVKADELQTLCAQTATHAQCRSVAGVSIFHYEKMTTKPRSKTGGKRILMFATIHGDEDPSGQLARDWMLRLQSIDPRNSWRVIPILNPDGLKLGTRTNQNGVDLNRNFPTHDWDVSALKAWRDLTKSNVRRYPGAKGGSEPEVHCALAHIEEYRPDLIVSIHTPLAVLDFDGPRVEFPKYDYLPWKSLGTFPGSMGRYMWTERKVPVLTVELKDSLPEDLSLMEKLQDVIGVLVHRL